MSRKSNAVPDSLPSHLRPIVPVRSSTASIMEKHLTYTRKSGVVCSGILLPSHAPPEYADRETLWNSVEQSEKHPKAQLAYSFDTALQKEFTMEENIALVKQFLNDHFISRGMIADYAVHAPEKDGGITNPHFHVMCPIRPLNPDGTWGAKQKREYILDEHGNRIRDGNGNYMFTTLFPQRTGEHRKRWRNGVRHGRNCATPNLQKKNLPTISTTAVMNDRVLRNCQPFTKVLLYGRWKRKEFRQTKVP